MKVLAVPGLQKFRKKPVLPERKSINFPKILAYEVLRNPIGLRELLACESLYGDWVAEISQKTRFTRAEIHQFPQNISV